jgi:membrane-bound serine protease (ClpP class)
MGVMFALGIALLVVGALLCLAEAHLASGGMLGGGAIMAGAAGLALLLAGLGTGLVVALVVALCAGAAGCAVLLAGARRIIPALRVRPRTGTEALVGRVGVVRSATDPLARVFVDGALWRAEPDWIEEETSALHEGDRVVVERVHGLTLCVRKAEEWELAP